MTENTVLDNNVSSIIKKENCIPKLRFSEFSTVWDLIRLSDVTTSFDYGLAYPSKEYDGENKYIRITDIDEETNSYCKNDIVSPDGKLTKDYLVDENDILFARTGASTGKTYLYNCEDGKLYFAGFLIRAHIKETINSKFIFLNTQTFRYKKWVAITSMRSGQPGINSQEYANYKFYLPNKMEQDKIADFITLIDNLIWEQLKYISILETYNRGLKMDILSQKIRFKDDSGNQYPDWEKAKLDEVFIERNTPQTITSDAPLLSFTIEDGVINPKDKKTNKRDFLIKDIDNKKFSLTEYNDIIYNPANLKFGAIHRNKLSRGVVSPIYAIFYTKENPVFMEYVVTNPIFIKKSLKYLEGTVIKLMTLKPKDFLLMDIYLPCLEEQEKIANFLSSLDNVLQEEKNYLEYLKTIKKGLLQQMFV